MHEPSVRDLAAALRRTALAARKVGHRHGWLPDEASEPYLDLQQRYADTEARMLAEAAISSQLLMQAVIEQTVGVANLLRAEMTSAPRVLARSAVESGVRICHALDPDADRMERARRRILEWSYAVSESEFRVRGALKAGLVTAPDEVAFLNDTRRDLDACVEQLGLSKGKNGFYLSDGVKIERISTLKATSTYLDGELRGLSTFLLRGDSAYAHGVETGLLSSTRDEPVHIPAPPFGYPPHGEPFILLPHLEAENVVRASITYMLVPKVLIRAFEVLVDVFHWSRSARAFGIYAEERDRLGEIWRAATGDQRVTE